MIDQGVEEGGLTCSSFSHDHHIHGRIFLIFSKVSGLVEVGFDPVFRELMIWKENSILSKLDF